MKIKNLDIGNGVIKSIFFKEGQNIISDIYFHKNGESHRDNDEPAVIHYYADGKTIRCESYYKYGKRCRKNKPSTVIYYRDGKNIKKEVYYDNNEIHKIDGPALIRYDHHGGIISEEYYLYGEQYNEFEYLIRVSNIK